MKSRWDFASGPRRLPIPTREHGDAGRTAANYDDPAAAPYLEAICTRLVGNLAAATAARPPLPALPVLW